MQRGATTAFASADACVFSVPGMTEFPTVLPVLIVTANDVGQESGVQVVTSASFCPANQSAFSHAASEGIPRPFNRSSQPVPSLPSPIASKKPLLSWSRYFWPAASAAASAAVCPLLRVAAACPTAKKASARKSRPPTATM